MSASISRSGCRDEIVGLIAEGVGDIGIVAGTVDAGGLTTYPFRTDRFVAVVAQEHPLAKRANDRFRGSARLRHSSGSTASERDLSAFSPARRRARPAAAAARAVAQLRRGVPSCRERTSAVGIVPHTTARARGQVDGDQGASSSTDAWAVRELTICVRDIDALPPFARQLVEHMRDKQRASAATRSARHQRPSNRDRG